MLPVRGTPSFWAELDEIPPGDLRREEIYDIAFELCDKGPNIERSHPILLPFGKRWFPGYWIDLPSGDAFIEYAAITATNDEYRVALLALIWY